MREDDARLQRLLNEYLDIKAQQASHLEASGDSSDVSKRKTFFSSITNSTEVQNAIFRYLSRERKAADHEAEHKTLFNLCDMLLAFYRFISGGSGGKAFTLASVAKDIERSRPVVVQYLPHLIAIYILSQDRKQFKFIETFLLVIYNCEAMETTPSNNASSSNLTKGEPFQPQQHSVSVNVPGLARNSVYHDSSRLDMSSVEMERVGGVTLRSRTFEMVKSVNATTRPKIFHLLFHVFNNHIMDMTKSVGLESFLKIILRVLSRGHQQLSLRTSTQVRSRQQHPKIHLPPAVLIEILLSAHHCIFNGLSTLGNQVVDLIELKATANGWSDVLLVVNSMVNLTRNWSGDGTGRGLRAATTDAHYANSPGVQLAKHMITNASFRAKKISEDIPKVLEKPGEQDMRARLMTNMKSITEEFGEEFPTLLNNSKDLNIPPTKTPTKGPAEETKKAAFNKEKFIAKLPNLKVGIHKRERLSENAQGDAKDGVSNGNNGAGPTGDSRPQRSSIEHTKEELGLLLPGKKRGKEDKNRGDKKSDDKSSKSDKKSEILKSEKNSGTKNEKKSEEKGSKQKKKQIANPVFNHNNSGIELTVTAPAMDVQGASDNNEGEDVDTLEKVEELIQMKRLPQETITIHSPESGTTIF